MALDIAAYQFLTTAFFYLLAASYLLYRIKIKKLAILYPLSVYLFGISIFFITMGLSKVVTSEYLLLLGALAVVLGASTIARFPLMLELRPLKERHVFLGLSIFSAAIVFIGFFTQNIMIMMRLAHAYAFVVAGLFTMGYIIYSGFRTENEAVKIKSIGTGVSMGLCCIVAHGLVATQLLASIALPLFGIFTLDLPLLFALLSPLAFIMVLFLTQYFPTTAVKKNE